MSQVNVYCLDKGWLFNDLKEQFRLAGCSTSTSPLKNSDAWICIRSSEMRISPDITRTIVQVHNMEPHDMHLFNAALGVVFTHPMQEWLWKRSGFNGKFVTIQLEQEKSFNLLQQFLKILLSVFFVEKIDLGGKVLTFLKK